MGEGSMIHAFEKAGLPPADNSFLLALSKYLNSGGTIERARALLDQAAAQMGEIGQALVASNGPYKTADLPRPTPSEGQSSCVQQDQTIAADARPPMLSADPIAAVQQDPKDHVSTERPMPKGQSTLASNGHARNAGGHPIASGKAKTFLPSPAKVNMPPAREPSRNYLEAAARSRVETIRTALYLHKTSTGKWFGDVRPCEFPGMKRDAKFAEAFETVFGPFNDKQAQTKCGDLLSAKQQEKVLELYRAA